MENNKGYDLENFDESKKTVATPNEKPPAKKNSQSYEEKKVTKSYGDGFSETPSDKGKTDASESGFYNMRDDDDYKNKNKKRSNRNIAIIFAIAAVVCLVIALIFVIAQCGNKDTDTLPSRPTVATVTQRATQPETTYDLATTQPQNTTIKPTETEPTTVASQADAPTTEPYEEPVEDQPQAGEDFEENPDDTMNGDDTGNDSGQESGYDESHGDSEIPVVEEG